MARRGRLAGRGRLAVLVALRLPSSEGFGGGFISMKRLTWGSPQSLFPEITLMQVHCYTDSRYTVSDFRYGVAVIPR